jgi:serine/threonine protein phosphatase 1
MSKTLVIGDIHGCYDELQALLDRVPLTSEDQIIHIGDLMDRGPHPEAVVTFFRETPNAHSIMGNRDDRHVRAYDGDLDYTYSRAITRQYQFSSEADYIEAIEYLRDLPLYMDLPDALLVHGYYEPGIPIEDQDRNVLLGHPPGERRVGPDWYQSYDGEKPLLIGHREYPFFRYQQKVYALDTRCVYGGMLTGVLLPDFTAYHVPARTDHWAALLAKYGDA